MLGAPPARLVPKAPRDQLRRSQGHSLCLAQGVPLDPRGRTAPPAGTASRASRARKGDPVTQGHRASQGLPVTWAPRERRGTPGLG